MKAKLVTLGNSAWLLIPRALLDQTGLRGEVDLVAEGPTLRIRPARSPRAGWRAATLKAVRKSKHAAAVDGDGLGLSRFDSEDWSW